MIECCHWFSFGSGGKCAAGLFGGKPSLGTCGQCQQRNKPLDEIHKESFRATMHTLNPDGSRCTTCPPRPVEFSQHA